MEIMSKVELRNVVANNKTATFQSFSELENGARFRIGWELFRLQVRLIFSHKFIWFMLGLTAWLRLMYYFNFRTDAVFRMTQRNVIEDLIYLPMVVLAVFLNMQLITAEKDNRTLEVMFTTSGSQFKVWLLKAATLGTILYFITLAICVVAFFGFTDMAILATSFYAFVPIYFIANLTLYFAVRMKSGLAAGMVTAAVLVILFFSNAIMEETDLYKYMLFLNPYSPPLRVDPATWEVWIWQNKIGVLILGTGLLYAALRSMGNRERLLR